MSYRALVMGEGGFMRVKITVEVDATSIMSGIGSDDVKKLLLLAQAGVVREHIDRLICAGSVPVGQFIPGTAASTYIDFEGKEKKET